MASSSFIKVILRETDDYVLFETSSKAVSKENEKEALEVESRNANYLYLTEGKGRNRKVSDAETQVPGVLMKISSVNTDHVHKKEVGTFVSNYDMYDTYAELERFTKSLDIQEERQIEVTTYKRNEADDFEEQLGRDPNFKTSGMLLQRMLAGNVFCNKQKRYRNMIVADPYNLEHKYLYSIDVMWEYKTKETMGKPVVATSFCPSNSDIIIIGYGVFHFLTTHERSTGCVCIWNIKNPVNPERIFTFPFPVTSIEMSPYHPQLLAVGLYNGAVYVIDISEEVNSSLIGRSRRGPEARKEPCWKIKWIKTEDKLEAILAIFQDGQVMKYSIVSGEFLLGINQLALQRVSELVEGIPFDKAVEEYIHVNACRKPQALTMTLHPTKQDIYFVGTDEGFLHRCSTSSTTEHKGVQRAHYRSVNMVEFSPFSPKIYLTCGNDWAIRVWIDDIAEPILELINQPATIHFARFSPLYSTLIVAVTRYSVEMWDLRRTILKPVSTKVIPLSSTTSLTTCRFTPCGKTLLVGDNAGTLYVCALEDMPFPAHFQYSELQDALYRELEIKPALLEQVKNLGHLGY